MTRASGEASSPRPLPTTTYHAERKNHHVPHEDDRRIREEAEEAERLAGEKAVRSVEAMKRADRATRRAALGAA